jgi:hypothetical protein
MKIIKFYAIVVGKPVSYPDELEIRYYVINPQTGVQTGDVFDHSGLISWEDALDTMNVPTESRAEIRNRLLCGESVTLMRGLVEFPVDDDFEFTHH